MRTAARLPALPTRSLSVLAVVSSTLLTTLLPTPAGAAPPAERAARLSTSSEVDSGRIVAIQPDPKEGVWALTRNGKLYHCRRSSTPEGERLRCTGRDGAVAGDY